jgi:hypothetical protein
LLRLPSLGLGCCRGGGLWPLLLLLLVGANPFKLHLVLMETLLDLAQLLLVLYLAALLLGRVQMPAAGQGGLDVGLGGFDAGLGGLRWRPLLVQQTRLDFSR